MAGGKTSYCPSIYTGSFDMWCLKGSEAQCIYILPNYQKTFGKSGDVKLEGDVTVSRLHAIISVKPNQESKTGSKCIISDLSKYGTFVLRNEEKKKLLTNEKFILKIGDKVQFGLKHSIFIVTCHSFMVTRSSLSKEEMEELIDIMKDLQGILLENWQNSCTHLITPERVLFTTKLACALASAKPIVTIRYWKEVKQAINQSRELPKIDDFLPTIIEESLHVHSKLFLPKEERKTLFYGLSFVHFCIKQYFAYAPLINAAGGKSCVYPTKKPLTPRDLTAKNAIVIQPANDSSQFTQIIAADYPIIYCKLNTLKRRMVSATEIPLAILYCSTEKYCNPKFDFGTLFKSTTQTFSPYDVVIVEDTQDAPINNKGNVQNNQQQIIPETCDLPNDNNISNKSYFSNKNKEKNIPGTSKNENNIISNVFSIESNEKLHIIPETCDILEKSVMNENFSRANNKQYQIIPESCERYVTNNLDVVKQQQEKNILYENIKFLQAEEISMREENNTMFEKNNLKIIKDNNSMLEKNNSILIKNKLMLEERNSIFEKNNSALEKDNSIRQNNENRGKSSKNNWRGPRIVSIEKISNDDRSGEICAERVKRKMLEICSEMKETKNLQTKKQKLNPFCNFNEDQKEDKNAEKIQKNMKNRDKERIEMKNREKKSKRMATDWYEKYTGHGFTNEILRKDVPCGKIFSKIPAPIPSKKLGADDFIL